MPGLILSPSPLMDADMNIHRLASKDRSLKYPPGLGYTPEPSTQTRRRSGSFTFTSGSNFASGNIFHGGYNTLTRPSPSSRLGKRSAVDAGLYAPQQRFDVFVVTTTTTTTTRPSTKAKFDPFGCDFDDEPVIRPMASSTSYSHYWEYDPSINGPKLRSTPPTPKKASSLPSSPRPRTIELPPPSPRKPRSSPPTSPTYKSPSTLAPLSVPDKNARSKLLAGILLNRIHAVGKPMRRRDYLDREYIKSGLSTVISVDC